MAETLELNYNFISLVDTVGLVQGMTLGVLLILLSTGKLKTTFSLGIFLMVFSIDCLPHILEGLNAFEPYPELFLLPFNNTWLLFPLFYLYTQKVSIFSHEKIHYWVIFLGIAIFLFQLIIFLMPFETKLVINSHAAYQILFVLGHFYVLYIAFINLKYINNHILEVGNYFSSLERKELK